MNFVFFWRAVANFYSIQMTFIGLYWSWDCEDFDEVVIVERIFFDYAEEPVVARVHCSNRPRVRDVEVAPGTRRWATLF